jgi:hypothetical protein
MEYGKMTVPIIRRKYLALHCMMDRVAEGYDIGKCAELTAKLYTFSESAIMKWYQSYVPSELEFHLLLGTPRGSDMEDRGQCRTGEGVVACVAENNI